MLEAGALAEVAAFAAIPGALSGTAGKAIGVPELGAHLAGRSSLAAAADLAVTRSRQYAKRQETWFRHQLDPSWTRLAEATDAPADKLIGSAWTL
jgi:tRNA dimethylallyltransferase